MLVDEDRLTSNNIYHTNCLDYIWDDEVEKNVRY